MKRTVTVWQIAAYNPGIVNSITPIIKLVRQVVAMLKYRRYYGDLARTWSEYRRVISTPAWGIPADLLHEQDDRCRKDRLLQTSRVLLADMDACRNNQCNAGKEIVESMPRARVDSSSGHHRHRARL